MADLYRQLVRDMIAELETNVDGVACDCDPDPVCLCDYQERLSDLADDFRRRLWVAELDAGRSR